MKIEKVNLVYFSATHTTQKVLRAIAKGCNLPVAEHDFTLPQNRTSAPAFAADELVVIGIPVYFGRLPVFVLEYLNKLKGSNTPCAVVGVYGNRHYDDALVELEDIAVHAKLAPVAAAAFVGEHSFSSNIAGGRPNSDDLAFAESFGAHIIEKCSTGATLCALEKGAIPGNRPYRDGGAMPPIAPIVSNNCDDCKLCANNCPMGAINKEDVHQIDGALCIKCRSCARICPVGAIDLTQEPFRQTIQRCEAGFAQPAKKPETFL